ncbi:MAG: hypothetical protein ACFCU8_04395 [Thermosynechococcaceae cyanobacterium]
MQANSPSEDPPQPSPIATIIGTAIATLTLVTPLYLTAHYSAKATPLAPWFQEVAPYRRS